MASAPVSAPSAPAPPPRAFCVALGANGPLKLTGQSVQDFSAALSQASIAWIDLTLDHLAEEAPAAASSLGFSQALATALLARPTSAYEDLETELGLAVPAVRIDALQVRVTPLLVLLRKGLIVTLHSPEIGRMGRLYRYADIVMKKLKPSLAWNDRLTLFLTRILDENNDSNFAGLRKIEEEGGKIGKLLIEPASIRPEVGKEIYQMKQALIAYLDALWATLDVVNSLRYGDAETITDEPRLLQRVAILGEEVNRHISLSEQMSTVLASGLEVLQSIYNNQLTILNNRISYVAFLLALAGTAFLAPNTLATIGPEALGLERGSPLWLPLLGLSSFVSTLVVYTVIRLKGWIPRTQA
ncbi:MAG: CorA family divalent cation transporter [Halobacteria archaeon]